MESWQFRTISLQPDWLIETGDWQFLMFDSSSTPSVSQSGGFGHSGHNLHNLHIAKFSVLSSASLDGFSVLFFLRPNLNSPMRHRSPICWNAWLVSTVRQFHAKDLVKRETVNVLGFPLFQLKPVHIYRGNLLILTHALRYAGAQ